MKPFMTPTIRSPHPGAWPMRLVPGAAALAILSACSVPPLQPPAPSVPLTAAFAQAGPAAAGQAFDGAWWAGYGDAALTALVEEALAANQDVAIAL
jgi:outer membrane protein TolC